jgi:Integrase core domain
VGFSSAIRTTKLRISASTPWRLDGFLAYVQFPRDELPMPSQNRVRRDDRSDLAQDAPSEPVARDGEPPPIVIRQLEPLPTQLTSKDPILFYEIRQGASLLAIQPTSQDREHHLESRRVDHGGSLYHGVRMVHSHAVGRTVGHYALNERHLRRVLAEWIPHYNGERPHTALGPGVPDEPTHRTMPTGHRLPQGQRVIVRARVGGLHHDYRLESGAA